MDHISKILDPGKLELVGEKEKLVEFQGVVGGKIRKSLPKFKGHLNRTFSLWIKPNSLAEKFEIQKKWREFNNPVDYMNQV